MLRWKVPKEWVGETAALLASGPSMTREQADYVRGKCRVIAINNQGIDTKDSDTGQVVPAFAPWADVLYAADHKWWECYQDRALKFVGYKISIRSGPFKEVHYVQQSSLRTYDPRPDYLVTGNNSGYQAIHLAVHFGVKRILLLGYDMKLQGKKKHWFGDHPKRLNSLGNFPAWRTRMDLFAVDLKKLGVEVINCTEGSALTCFPKKHLKDVI